MPLCGLINTVTHSARDIGAKTLLSMTSKNDIAAGQGEAWPVWKTCLGPCIQWKPEWNQAMSLNKWKEKKKGNHPPHLDSFSLVCSLECEIITTFFFFSFSNSPYSEYFLSPCSPSFPSFISQILSHIPSVSFLNINRHYSKLSA